MDVAAEQNDKTLEKYTKGEILVFARLRNEPC